MFSRTESPVFRSYVCTLNQDFVDFVNGPLNSNLVLVTPKVISLNLVPRHPPVWQYDPDNAKLFGSLDTFLNQ